MKFQERLLWFAVIGIFAIFLVNALSLSSFGDGIFNGNLTINHNLTVDGNFTVTNLVSCDTVDTNTDGQFRCGDDGGGAGGNVFDQDLNTTDGPRFRNLSIGKVYTQNASLEVNASDILTGIRIEAETGDSTAFSIFSNAAEFARLLFDGNSGWSFGGGSVATDAKIERTSVGTIRISDNLIILFNLTVENIIANINITAANLMIEDRFYHLGDLDTFIDFPTTGNRIDFNAGGFEFLALSEGVQDLIHFNSAGNDVDFRYDGETNTRVFFINGNTERVGIRDTSPDYQFEVNFASSLGFFGITNVSNGDIFEIDGGGHVGIGDNTPTSTLVVNGNVTIAENLTISANITFSDDNDGICWGDTCNGSIYWNGTALIIKAS